MVDERIRVLLIEDDRDYASMVCAILDVEEPNAYDVTATETLAQTVAVLEAELFDVIILDLMLPDSHGVQTLERVQAQAAGVPIVIVSGIDDKQSIFDAMVRGAQDYLIKNEHLPKLLTHALHHAIERKAVERALQESENRYRTIFESAADAVLIVDPRTGKPVESNQEAERLLGYAHAELAQIDMADLVESFVDPSASQAFFARVAENGPLTQEWRCVERGGARHTLQACCSPVPLERKTFVLVVMHDVTERRLIEDRLERLNACFLSFGNAAAENINRLVELCGRSMGADVAVYTRLEDDHTRVVGAWNTLPGFPLEYAAEGNLCFDVLRRGCEDLVIVEDLQNSPYAAVLPTVSDKPLRTYAGQSVKLGTRYAGVLCVMYTHQHTLTKPDHWFMRALGSAVSSEENRSKLEKQIQRTQKIESLGVLAGGVAHDFNNLLMGVLGNADLAALELKDDSTAYRRMMDIKAAAGRAAELCRQMLAYSGRGRFMSSDIDLSASIREMRHLVDAMVPKKVAVEYTLGTDLPHIEGDPSQIRQLILNLVNNAHEAIASHTGTITIETGSCRCEKDELRNAYLDEALPAGQYVYVRITDTGCGMTPELCERIFDPFFTTKFTGRGLGLAAVLGVLRAHHGALRVHSRPGEGSVFTVFLPEKAGHAETYPHPVQRVADTGKQQSILVVDGEPTVLNLAADMIRHLRLSALKAASGAEAVALYREHADDIAAVILDLFMKDMDGHETAVALRAIDPNVCIVLSSVYRQDDAELHFAGQPPAAFIRKPYELSDLRTTLIDALGRALPDQ
jgi:PAS domain S-box-containing protein